MHVVGEIHELVNASFGKILTEEDIFEHITTPDEVCLLRENGTLLAMRSHSRTILSGFPTTILEGAAIHPNVQGNGLYSLLLDQITFQTPVYGTRTQNPHTYVALEKYCSAIYPANNYTPDAIVAIRNDLAKYFGSSITEKGVVKDHYGSLFYGEEPKHQRISKFFSDELDMDIYRGDAVLLLGIK